MKSPAIAIRLVRCYLALCVLTLVAVALLRNTSQVTSAVWARATIITFVAVLTLLVTTRAVRISDRWILRLRLMAAAQIVAIIVIVAIPGVFPIWLRIEQAVCGVLLAGVLWSSAPH